MEQSQEFDKSDTHPQTLLKGAKVIRDDKRLFDFTIIANGKRFAAHKLILAATSDFFSAMLQHDSIESQTNECCLKDVTPAALERILEFCYTSRIKLDIENVQETLMAASILQIDSIQSLCVEYIAKRIDITNCLGVLILADRYNLSTLIESSLNLCLDKFEAISREDEFLQLDASLLSKIISHDHLLVANEEIVLSAVQKWIAAEKERTNELDNLANHVRFPLMSARSLVILSRDQMLQSKKCQDLIREAKDHHLLEASEDELRSQMVGKRFELRCPLRRQQRIFAVGGWTDEFRPIDTAEKYDPHLDRWIEINKMTKPRCGVGLSILDDCLYAIGGHDGQSYLSSVERYNIKEDIWLCDVADMKFERTSVGVCTWNGYIYAIGGQVGSHSSNVVERYNPATKKWEECPSVNQQRLGAGVTVCNNSIYVVGGGTNSVALNTVERFDASKNEWTFVAPMTTSRKHLGCTAFEGKIYAIGGRGDSSELDTAECYDPVQDCWEPIPSMSVKRSGIGLVEMEGTLYAVGGHNGDARLKLVEAYDPVKKEWTTKCPMIYARLGGGLALYSPIKQVQALCEKLEVASI